MGIGNIIKTSVRELDVDLITPHGDRKPAIASRSATRSSRSLPLMGIGNWTSAFVSLACLNSLPLMGIGNGLGCCPCRMLPGCSLPLMGIGNQHKGRCYDYSQCSHYPSWGSETVQVRALYLRFRGLITPHGDRKRSLWVSITCMSLPSHYPSWGSETRDLFVDDVFLIGLITPHGDRKPVQGRPF